MAILLKPHERLVCIGSSALRAPDGTPLDSVPIYKIVDESSVNAETGMSDCEADFYEKTVARKLAPRFKQYTDELKKETLHV